MLQLAEINISAVDRVRYGVGLLKTPANMRGTFAHLQGRSTNWKAMATAMRGAISRLFRDEQDVRELIKLKAV